MKSKSELLKRIDGIENELASLLEQTYRGEIEADTAIAVSNIHRAELHSIQIQLDQQRR